MLRMQRRSLPRSCATAPSMCFVSALRRRDLVKYLQVFFDWLSTVPLFSKYVLETSVDSRFFLVLVKPLWLCQASFCTGLLVERTWWDRYKWSRRRTCCNAGRRVAFWFSLQMGASALHWRYPWRLCAHIGKSIAWWLRLTVALADPRLFGPAAGILPITDIAVISMPFSSSKDCRLIYNQTYQSLRVAKLLWSKGQFLSTIVLLALPKMKLAARSAKKRRKMPKSVCPGHGRKRGKSPVGHAPLAELVLELLADLVLEPLAERGLTVLRNSRADSRVLSRNTRPDAWWAALCPKRCDLSKSVTSPAFELVWGSEPLLPARRHETPCCCCCCYLKAEATFVQGAYLEWKDLKMENHSLQLPCSWRLISLVLQGAWMTSKVFVRFDCLEVLNPGVLGSLRLLVHWCLCLMCVLGVEMLSRFAACSKAFEGCVKQLQCPSTTVWSGGTAMALQSKHRKHI